MIDQLIADLTDYERATSPASFPSDRAAAAQPGLYAWHGDDEARDVISSVFGVSMPKLLYSGQAGATKWPSGKRSTATLKSRVGGNHIGGNARSSTFRLTLSTVLLQPLGLSPAGSRLTAESNAELNRWMRAHLRVAIAAYPDRDTLGEVEQQVVRLLDPPLNLDHCDPSEVRTRLTQLRRLLPRRQSAP